MTQCLTALSFAARRSGRAGLRVRQPDRPPPPHARHPSDQPATAASRTRSGRATSSRTASTKARSSCSTTRCVVLDPGAKGDNLDDLTDAGYAYFVNIGASEPRRAFNNILVAVYTSTPTSGRSRSWRPAEFVTQSDGNTFFRIPAGAEDSINFQIRRKRRRPRSRERQVPHPGRLPRSTSGLRTGRTGTRRRASSAIRCSGPSTSTGRPRHGDDLRLHTDSPAKDNVADLPQDLRTCTSTPPGEEPLDRGCYPHTGARLQVGVDGRRIFPFMRPGLGNGTHPDDIPPVFAHDS